MKNRKLIISGVGLVIVAVAIYLAGLFESEPQAAAKKDQTAAVVVDAITIENQEVTSTIKITGRVQPEERIDLFAEVAGVAQYGTKPFKTGVYFDRGDVLLKINDDEFRSNLASVKSQFSNQLAQVLPDIKIDYPEAFDSWKAYFKNFKVEKRISPLPEVKQEQLKFFLTGRTIYSSYYNIKELENRLEKYTLRAPFDGYLTDASLDRGTLVRIGQSLGEFIKKDAFELEASVTFNDLPYLKTGTVVSFKNVNSNQQFEGTLSRINEKIDPSSQLVKVFFKLSGPVKSGLYLKADVPTASFDNAFKIPTQSLVDENTVFVIENEKAVKKTVEIIERGSDEIIARGLTSGSQVITSRKNSAFEGTKVIVANE